MFAEDVEDALGVGKRVVLEVADFNELGYWGRPGRMYANRIYTYALYENNPALVCGFGLKIAELSSASGWAKAPRWPAAASLAARKSSRP